MRKMLVAATLALGSSLGLFGTEAEAQSGWSVDNHGSSMDDSLVSLFGRREAVDKLEASAKASGWNVVDSGETKGGSRFLLLRRTWNPSEAEKLWNEAQGLGVAIGPMMTQRTGSFPP